MAYDQLYDKIHAIMVEELLGDLRHIIELQKKQGMGNGLLTTEEPFNVYGNRGFVDILHHGKWPIDEDQIDLLSDNQVELLGGKDLFTEALSLYECKPRITNLNDTLRQVTKYSEFVVQDFRKKYPKRPVGLCFTSLVLLNTKENCDLILRFKNSFLAAFQNAPGVGHFERKNRKWLVLFDPLEDYMDYYDPSKSFGENIKAAEQCERMRSILFSIGDNDDASENGIIGEKYLHAGYHYQDTNDFYKQYMQKKIEKS